MSNQPSQEKSNLPVAIHLPVDGKVIEAENLDKRFQQTLIREKHNLKKDFERKTQKQAELHKQFTTAWAPLVERLRFLSERYLNGGQRLNIDWSVDDKFLVQMNVNLYTTAMHQHSLGTYEKLVSSLTFYNFNHPWNRKLWPLGERTTSLSSSMFNKGTDSITLRVSNMEKAYLHFEKWLARNVVSNLDQSRITPHKEETIDIAFQV